MFGLGKKPHRPLQKSFCWHVSWSPSARDAPSSFGTFGDKDDVGYTFILLKQRQPQASRSLGPDEGICMRREAGTFVPLSSSSVHPEGPAEAWPAWLEEAPATYQISSQFPLLGHNQPVNKCMSSSHVWLCLNEIEHSSSPQSPFHRNSRGNCRPGWLACTLQPPGVPPFAWGPKNERESAVSGRVPRSGTKWTHVFCIPEAATARHRSGRWSPCGAAGWCCWSQTGFFFELPATSGYRRASLTD